MIEQDVFNKCIRTSVLTQVSKNSYSNIPISKLNSMKGTISSRNNSLRKLSISVGIIKEKPKNKEEVLLTEHNSSSQPLFKSE